MLWVFIPVITGAQTLPLKLTNLTREQGLSNNSILSIAQDDKGFIWFGTGEGLNRYDGNQIVVYKSVSGKANTLSNNNIQKLFVDSRHRLWVATSYGLNLYNATYENFNRFLNKRLDEHSLSSSNVMAMAEDSSGVIWIGTGSGLNKYNEKNGTFLRYVNNHGGDRQNVNTINCVYPASKNLLWLGTKSGGITVFNIATKAFTTLGNGVDWERFNTSVVKVIVKIKSGNYWIGTAENGIFVYDPKTGTIVNYRQQQYNAGSLSSNVIKDILCDHKGQIWICTENGGVVTWQPATHKFLPYGDDPYNVYAFNQKTSMVVFEDNQKNIWIGSHKGGVYKYSPNASVFKTFTQGNIPGSLSYRDVKCFFETSGGELWIGTDGGGINIWDKSRQKFTYFKHDPLNPKSISSDAILYIKQDSHNRIWVGTWGGGLNLYNGNGTFTRFVHNPLNKNSIGSDNAFHVFEDSKGVLYVSTYYQGVDVFDPLTGNFKRFTGNGKYQFSGSVVLSVCEDSYHQLWMGTLDGGLNCISADRRRIDHYFINGVERNNSVRAVFVDHARRLWAGRSGLFLYNHNNKAFTQAWTDPQFPDERIQVINEDEQGNLWMGTTNGLVRFNPDTKKTKRYTTADGIQGLDYSTNSSYKTRSGELLFGGTEGFNVFYPDRVRSADYYYPVYITNLLIFNKSVNFNSENAPVTKSIIEENEVKFNYNQSDFSFEYAALNYVAQGKTQYAYMLKGFDKDWNYVGGQRKAIYTNLNPGHYIFMVKASRPDGSWNTAPKTILIIVRPPFWLTWWFESLAALSVITIIFVILYYRRKSELRVFHEQKKEEMHQMQLNFFTNISHEFRTPLTLIMGTLEQIQKKEEGSALNRYHQAINRNANRLMQLISELMDFRKSASGSLKLKVARGDFDMFIVGIKHEFEDQAVYNQISFNLTMSLQLTDVYFDCQVLEKILLNLLNNSFKYTPTGGCIQIEVSNSLSAFNPSYEGEMQIINEFKGKEYLYISIKDSGIGISKESISNLFERYFRVSNHHIGSGIGLAFVKSLTLLHKGSIYVYSEHQKGTQIIIAIPCSVADYSTHELSAHHDETAVVLESVVYKQQYQQKQPGATPIIAAEKERKTILIVDDNEELRTYFKEILEPFYTVLEADNGNSGLDKARINSPALIISDIMMPIMDGLDFCAQLRDDFQTSHIPFILLTAKDALESKLEGMGSGADYYFSKPVSTELLLLTIKNILAQREKVKERYQKDYLVAVHELVHTEKDKALMDKLLAIITRKLEDTDLNVDFVSREVGVSTSKLYKKIRDITGQSPIEFIRSVRLKRAIEIMTHEDVLVTEVMYRVGILSQSYFTTIFKKEFGITPSQFQQQLDSKKAIPPG